MMGAAMLKHHQFVQSLWALYRLVVSSITFVCHLYVGESGAALVKCNNYGCQPVGVMDSGFKSFDLET